MEGRWDRTKRRDGKGGRRRRGGGQEKVERE